MNGEITIKVESPSHEPGGIYDQLAIAVARLVRELQWMEKREGAMVQVTSTFDPA